MLMTLLARGLHTPHKGLVCLPLCRNCVASCAQDAWGEEPEQEDMQEEPSRPSFTSAFPFAAFSGFETRVFACTSALLLQ